MTPQTGPGPIIYQQHLDPNLSVDSGIIEAQLSGNFQPMVYVPGPQNVAYQAPPGNNNYVYYAQPTAQQSPQVPAAPNSAAQPNTNYQASPNNQ